MTVRDADGNSTTVPVTLAIDPATTAPGTGLRFGDPGGTDAVHISVAPTDRFTDQLGHLVVHNPSYATTVAGTAAITQPGDTAVDTIGVGETPTHIAVSPDGSRAYITNTSGKSVTVINTATNDVIATIPVGRTPTQVAVSADGARAYVINTASNTMSVINTEPDTPGYNTVVATVRVGWTPTQIAVSPDGKVAYVTNTTSKSVSVINTTTYTVVDTVDVGDSPFALAVVPGGTLPIIGSPSTPSAPDPTTGAVTGYVGVVDPDGDPLDFSVAPGVRHRRLRHGRRR